MVLQIFIFLYKQWKLYHHHCFTEKPLISQMEKHSFPEKGEVEHYQDVTNVYLCVRTCFQGSVSWAYLEKV